MRKRLKGLDLIRVPKELWMEVCDIVQEAGIKTIPKKKKGKTVVWRGLTNSYEKKRSKRQRTKGYMVGIYLTGILGWVREENSMIENNLIKVSIIASSILAWRIRWTEEPGGLLSMGSHRVGHNWSNLACMHALEKEMATHSSVLAWRIPGTEEPVGCHLWGRTESDTTEAT